MAFENTGALAIANALSNLGNSFGDAMKERYKVDLYSDAANDLQAGRYGDAGAKLMNVDPRAGLAYITQQNATDQFNKAYGGGSLSDLGAPAQGGPMSLAGAILSQESGNNPNIGKSIDGALGVGQILPDTFKRFARPGENINNPEDNARVSNRILETYMQKYGDPARAATAYFSGEGNVAPPGSPTPWKRDTHDGNNKFVSSYVSDVLGRMGMQPRTQTAQAGGTMSDVSPSLIVRANKARWAIANPNIPDAMKEAARLELQDIQSQISEQRILNRQNRPELKQFGNTVYSVSGDNMTPVKQIEQNEKPPNDSQNTAAGYAMRLREADNIINSVDEQGKPIWQDAMGAYGQKNRALEYLPVVGRTMMSENYQRYLDARERFIINKLRPESGAAIGEDEFDREARALFPQPGDKAKTIRDKAIARQNVIKTQAMKASPEFQRQFYGDGSGSQQGAASPTGSVGSAKQIPSAILNEARRAIATKGRDAVINRLRQEGFDTSGL